MAVAAARNAMNAKTAMTAMTAMRGITTVPPHFRRQSSGSAPVIHTATPKPTIAAIQARLFQGTATLETKRSKFDHGFPQPPHRVHITRAAEIAKTKGCPQRSHTIGEFDKSHRPPDWVIGCLSGYDPLEGNFGAYQSVPPASARKGFEHFYHAITGRKVDPKEGVILVPGSSSGITDTLLYLKSIGRTVAVPQSTYPTYNAIHLRTHGKEAPTIRRPFTAAGMKIDTENFPPEVDAVLVNTIGNPGAEHLTNLDLKNIIEAILKSHEDAIIVLDQAYQGISGPIPDKFVNIDHFLSLNPHLKGKVKFIELFSTSKIGGGPAERNAGIVVDPDLAPHFSTFQQPTQLGVSGASYQFWAKVARVKREDIQEYLASLFAEFHNNNDVLTAQLATSHAIIPPHQGGMFNVVNLEEEFAHRLERELGGKPNLSGLDGDLAKFSAPDFVESTLDHEVVNGHIVYFTFVPEKPCLRVNLGDPTPKIKQFADDLNVALDLYVKRVADKIRASQAQISE